MRWWRQSEKFTLDKGNIGRMLLNRKAEILQRVCLGDDSNIVFESENLANSDTVNSLRVRKNNADRTRLNRSV